MIDLHHAGPAPDWENVKPKARNFWQRLAAKTNGTLTPGNVASLIGLALVIWGLIDITEGNVFTGLVKIGIGRLMDLVDGAVAHATRTKSLLSEAVDAVVDKIELVLGLPILMYQGILPLPVGIIIGLQNLANITLVALARKTGNEISPSNWGKYATAVQWVAIVLYCAAAVGNQWGYEAIAEGLEILAHITAGMLFVPMGLAATAGYAHDALAK